MDNFNFSNFINIGLIVVKIILIIILVLLIMNPFYFILFGMSGGIIPMLFVYIFIFNLPYAT